MQVDVIVCGRGRQAKQIPVVIIGDNLLRPDPALCPASVAKTREAELNNALGIHAKQLKQAPAQFVVHMPAPVAVEEPKRPNIHEVLRRPYTNGTVKGGMLADTRNGFDKREQREIERGKVMCWKDHRETQHRIAFV